MLTRTARDVARDAFVYGLASIDLYRILHDFVLDPGSPEYKGPCNTLWHARGVADTTDRAIVAMNVDTPYSYAWLDLRAEPVVLTMPAFEPDRYVSAQLSDLYTYIVGYVSPRTNGHRGGDVLVAGPRGPGSAPDALPVVRCPTDLLLVLVRTQLFGDDDLANVVRLQDAMAVTPLSAFCGTAAPAPAAPLTPIEPVDVRAAPDARAFDVLDWMLRLMPELPEDAAIRAELRAIGVGPGADPAARPDAATLRAAIADAIAAVRAYAATLTSSAGIFGGRELLAGDPLARAAGAYLGILGNAAEEYLGVGYQGDAHGRPFTGERRYRIRFAPGALPPVDAFWSITLYDAAQHLYDNEIGRHVLGSRQLAGMARDPDGGVTIDVRHDRPDGARIGNWLPCPAGPFSLTFRTYLPRAAIRDGAWTAPPVEPIG